MSVIRFDVVTNGSGAYVGTSVVSNPALLYGLDWVDGTLDDGVDATLTLVQPAPGDATKTLLTLTDANSDATYKPRVVEHDAVGAALATRTLPLVHGTLTLTVGSGGSAKSGAMFVYLIPLEG